MVGRMDGAVLTHHTAGKITPGAPGVRSFKGAEEDASDSTSFLRRLSLAYTYTHIFPTTISKN